MKTAWWTQQRLEKHGWVFYSAGPFVEDLSKIASLIGSTIYEVMTIPTGNYIRRVG